MTEASKTAAYSKLRARLNADELELYEEPVLLADLRRLRTRYAAGRASVVNPRSGDSHGDVAQALALAVWRQWGFASGLGDRGAGVAVAGPLDGTAVVRILDEREREWEAEAVRELQPVPADRLVSWQELLVKLAARGAGNPRDLLTASGSENNACSVDLRFYRRKSLGERFWISASRSGLRAVRRGRRDSASLSCSIVKSRAARAV
jgi:hypothetical protein